MAEIVSLIGTTHHPWYYAKTSVPEDELSDDGRAQLAWSAKVQDAIRAAEPEAIVLVASDHFHQFFADNMPQFVVGRMDAYEGTFYNEVREFGLPRVRMPGNRRLSTDIIEAGFEHGFDFAFSDELRLDHACVVPSLIAQPDLEIPVVPVLTNCGAPPIPPGRRFVELGQALRRAIKGSTAVDRVAVVVSGHLSLEVGGPEQMLPRPVDVAFDDEAMTWLRERDFDRLTSEATFQRMLRRGNASFQFLNLISMAALQQDMKIGYAEAEKGRGSSKPCFIYEPAGSP